MVLLLVMSAVAFVAGVAQLSAGLDAIFPTASFFFAVVLCRQAFLRVAVDADRLYVRNPFWTYTLDRSKVSAFQIEKVGFANVQIEAVLWDEPRPVALKVTYRTSPAFNLGLFPLEPLRDQLNEWLKAPPSAPHDREAT